MTLEVMTRVERWVVGGYVWDPGRRHGAEFGAGVFASRESTCTWEMRAGP